MLSRVNLLHVVLRAAAVGLSDSCLDFQNIFYAVSLSSVVSK